MRHILPLSAALAATLMASTDAELENLKAQMRKQQAVIEALQHRVEELEHRDLSRQRNELKEAAHYHPASHGDGEEGTHHEGVTPHLALIANVSAVARDLDNAAYASATIPGFVDTPVDQPFNPRRGFNANYAELDIGAGLGGGWAVESAFHIEPDNLAIGELYVKNEALPYDLALKAGRYRSGFGLINAYHHHAWAFTSMPLVYESYFGPEGMSDEGIQLHWCPREGSLLGIEAMQGSNNASFGDTDGVNLGIAYFKQSIALNQAATLHLGGTYMQGRRTDGGRTEIYGGELAVGWRTGKESGLMWRNEALWRDRDGLGTQAGLYTELLYDITREWGAGARYDRLFENVAGQPEDLARTTVMLHWLPFEAMRLRLQYSYDDSKAIDGRRRAINEVLLDLTIEAGEHHEHAH